MTQHAHEPITQSDVPAIRIVMMPRDTNPQGCIFGGVILSLIDQAAYVEARRHAEHAFVTVAMDSVEFHEPVFVGDVCALWATTKRIGRSSIAIEVIVRATRRTGEEVTVTQAQVTLVAIDANGKPTAVAS